jgi:hypothetical protein
VYVHRFDGAAWQFETALIAEDQQALSWLGSSNAIVGDTILAGAYAQDVGPVRAGAGYLFQYEAGQWSQRDKIESSDAAQSDQVGFSAAFDGRWLALGAPYEDDGAADAGACYLFDLAVGVPVISRQPSSLRILVGSAAGFSVAAVGVEPLSYRWQKDEVDLVDGGQIAGASTSQLRIASTVLADAGSYRCVVQGDCGETTSLPATLWLDTAVGASGLPAGGRLVLLPNRPNPFNPSTTIRFQVPADGAVTLRIYTLRGELVVTLFEREVLAGPQTVIWRGLDRDGRAVASGVYIFRLTGFGQAVARRLTLVR